MAELKVGDRAPDFTLPGTIGEKVKLGDYLGKRNVVLVFYVLDWSPVCTDELCGMRDGIKAFEGLDAQILGISVDSIFSHRAWAEKYGINSRSSPISTRRSAGSTAYSTRRSWG